MAIEETMVLYDYAREGFLDGTLDFDADTIEAKAMKSGYIPSSSTHQFLSDVDAGEILASGSAALASKATADGVAKAGNVTFLGADVGTGNFIVGFLLVDTSVDVGEGGRLIAYIGKDSDGNTLDIETTGDDLVIRFGAATQRIFSV